MDHEGPLGGTSKDHLVELDLQEGAGICTFGQKNLCFCLFFFFLGSEGMVFTESGIF